MPQQLLIVGGGQAAAQAAQTARQSGYDGKITIVGEEPCLPYQRPPLSKKFLADEVGRERLNLKPETFYSSRDIELRLDTRVDALDIGRSRIGLADGSDLAYTELLLATGSEPRRLDVPGADLAGIHYFRSIADVEAIKPSLANGARLVIVGGGYIGLEVAAVAIAAGVEVTVLEFADRVMGRSVCREVSAFYADYHRSKGVDLRVSTEVKAFHGDGQVREVETASGEKFGCDIAIVCVGITPCVDLAARAGLDIDDGIAVDPYARTSAAKVFAAGDCTSHPHPWVGRRIRLESVQNAIEQGKAAGASIAGDAHAFDAIPWFWSDQYDLKLQIVGLSPGFDQIVIRGDTDDGQFSVFYLKNGHAIAVDSINDPRTFIAAKSLLASKPKLPPTAIADRDCDLAALVED
ncbi:MAG: FAD-dependent oxidoreductase [Gammaproteobacteria bacterium]|nr:FAD-dependent oxidoreductase [Gammaproteobacteria bacterium]